MAALARPRAAARLGAISATGDFFDALPAFDRFDGVVDEANYRPLPHDWALGVADVVGSTRAIADGRYKAVNMAGAAVIAAIQNAAGQSELPFVFGGDGALVALAPDAHDAARDALAAMQAWVSDDLELEIRAALVPVAEIRAVGHDVRAARFRVSAEVTYAMFSGGGAAWADGEAKAGRFLVRAAPSGTRPDLSGLSCRFRPVGSSNGTILSLITVPRDGRSEAFAGLVADIVGLLGEQERGGHPLPRGGVKVRWPPAGASVRYESRALAARGRRLAARATVLLQSGVAVISDRSGRPLFGFDAPTYNADVELNSDFRKFDDGLKLTVDVTPEVSTEIEERLEAASAAGICRYGIHRQDEALITCITPSIALRNHVHFIDGAAGGYAMAAAMLKASG